jgi:hypothetical protein
VTSAAFAGATASVEGSDGCDTPALLFKAGGKSAGGGGPGGGAYTVLGVKEDNDCPAGGNPAGLAEAAGTGSFGGGGPGGGANCGYRVEGGMAPATGGGGSEGGPYDEAPRFEPYDNGGAAVVGEG